MKRTHRSTSGASGSTAASSGSKQASSPVLASAPRSLEVLWSGQAAPGFTLKRKRTGAILVSTVDESSELAVGSELKLVGGFPVNRLSLSAVKKVMQLAPKPVSLVFVRPDTVVRRGSLVESTGDDRGSLVNEFAAEERRSKLKKRSSASLGDQTSSTMSQSELSSADSVSVSASSDDTERPRRRRRDHGGETKAKKRKVSRLQVAFDRVNQLLNRPVRQGGLNVAAGQTIVV